jgi:hypothetical protein
MRLRKIEGARKNFQEIGQEEDVFKRTKLSADAGFHSEEKMKMVFTEEIDAYVAANQYRKHDSRFADYDRYKERHRKERARHEGRKGLFAASAR